MILFNIILHLIALSFCVSTAYAQKNGFCDQVPTQYLAGLALDGCRIENGLVIQTFRDKEASSPYAGEFDRRTLVFASGVDALSLRKASGVNGSYSEFSSDNQRLVRPPMEEQIASKVSLKGKVKHRGWTVLTERVQYGSQGGAPGYVIDCATAWNSTHAGATAVAECFPLEERSRFYQVLDLIQ